MKIWKIEYISYANRVRTTTIETLDDASEDDVIDLALKEEGKIYSDDNIYKILSVDMDYMD